MILITSIEGIHMQHLGIIIDRPEFYTLLAMTLTLAPSYIIGRAINVRRLRHIWRVLVGAWKPHAEGVKYQVMGTNSFRIVFNFSRISPLREIELVPVLLPRENLFHYIHSKVRGDKDVLIIRANVRDVPFISLELYSKRLAKGLRPRAVKGLEEVPVGELANTFVARSNNPVLAGRLIKDISDVLLGMRGKLHRLSISRKEPNVVVVSDALFRDYAPLWGLTWKLSRSLRST